MNRHLFTLLACSSIVGGVAAQGEPFTRRVVVASGLNRAWEIVYGPGDSLFVTENVSYLVSRINIANGAKTVLLNLSSQTNFLGSGPQPQGGLMGLALHPNLYSTDPAVRNAKPWVYVAYVYNRAAGSSSCPNSPTSTGCFFTTRIVRYDYRGTSLTNPVTVLDNIPGSSDHNSGRLVISPIEEVVPGGGSNTQYRLYYTVGDMGSGQLTNTLRVNNAQQLNIMEGKVLRINTEVDGDSGADAWVPDDNPFYNGTPITAEDYVYSLGHRNPQGLAWGRVNGSTYRLYSSEQLDKSDDEVNIIERGANYGWDRVSGYCDNDVNGFKIGGQNIPNTANAEVNNCNSITGNREPILTLFHAASYPTSTTSSSWPTVALSSVAYYGSYKIPNWKGSLLVTPLKEARVYRIKLNSDGTAVDGAPLQLFTDIGGNRLRRVIAAPDGLRFYVARDNGSITEYTYTGVISTLPLDLLSFTGALQGNATNLEWTTAQEVNTDKFIVERSIDGINYTEAATVMAAGNTTRETNYNFRDHEAMQQPTSTLYYRLKMIDRDGEFKYSAIVTVSLVALSDRLILSPNPVNGAETRLTIVAVSSGDVVWRLRDNTGREVLQGKTKVIPGNNQVRINTANLKAGIYYLRVSGVLEQQVKLQKL